MLSHTSVVGVILRIAYVSTYPPTHCGVGEYTRMLVAAMKSVNSNVTIYVLCDENCGEERYDSYAGAYVYPTFKKRSSSYDSILNQLSRIGDVDLIHVQHEYGIFGSNDSILQALIKAKSEGLVKKVVFTLHTVQHPLYGDKESLDFQRRLSYADAIIVHSYLQEFEIQQQSVDPIKIYRIPHGTLLNPFLGAPRFKLIEQLGIKGENIKGYIMTTPGFLRRDKGLDILSEALEYLRRRGNTDMTLIVAGELRDKEVLSFLDYASKYVNVIVLERYLSNEEILKLIALADIVMLPYRDKLGMYSVSGILHLSMGSFKPIVGTRVPRLIELYQFAPRLTAPPRTPIELAKRISWVIENYDYAVNYMGYMYGYAVRTQWLRAARKHLALYQELLSI